MQMFGFRDLRVVNNKIVKLPVLELESLLTIHYELLVKV